MTKTANITAKRVREELAYDANTGVFTRRIARGGRKVGHVAGCKMQIGYLCISLGNKLYYAHRLAWLYMTGEWPQQEIDHINGNGDDNRFCNLREATSTQNKQNRRLARDTASGKKGVYWHSSQKSRAQITVDGQWIGLGCFDNQEDAARAYADAAKKYFGEFARLR